MKRKFTKYPVMAGTNTDVVQYDIDGLNVSINLIPKYDRYQASAPVESEFTQDQIDDFIDTAIADVLAATSEKQRITIGLTLKIRYTHRPEGTLLAWLESTQVEFKSHLKDFPAVGWMSGYSQRYPDWDYDEISAFAQECSKAVKKLQRLSTKYQEVPEQVLEAAWKFNYWISKEGNYTRDAVAARTVNNPRSGMYQNTDDIEALDTLFDYIERNNCTESEIRALCRDGVYMMRRRRQE